MTDTNRNNLKVGDRIFVEQAWEDEAGNYHDEFAVITNISTNPQTGYQQLSLKFRNDEITDFLKDAEFDANDYEAES